MEFSGDSPLIFIAGVYDNPIRVQGVCVCDIKILTTNNNVHVTSRLIDVHLSLLIITVIHLELTA